MATSYFKADTKNFMNDLERANEVGLTKAAAGYAILLKDTLSVPPARTGKIYHNLKGKPEHQASASGEPPAPLTHKLKESIDSYYDVESQKAIAYSDVKYALSLEYGIPGRLAKRPYFYPTIMNGRNAEVLGELCLEFMEEELVK